MPAEEASFPVTSLVFSLVNTLGPQGPVVVEQHDRIARNCACRLRYSLRDLFVLTAICAAWLALAGRDEFAGALLGYHALGLAVGFWLAARWRFHPGLVYPFLFLWSSQMVSLVLG